MIFKIVNLIFHLWEGKILDSFFIIHVHVYDKAVSHRKENSILNLFLSWTH